MDDRLLRHLTHQKALSDKISFYNKIEEINLSIWLVCLGFYISFQSGVISQQWQWHIDHCAATLECHAADTGHDTQPCHSVQTLGQPAAVISIDVECHTGIHNYAFLCLGSNLTEISFPALPYTDSSTTCRPNIFIKGISECALFDWLLILMKCNDRNRSYP